MYAYKNKPELKNMILAEVVGHRKADRIVQGIYGSGDGKEFKGCAVGCSIHSLNVKLKKNYELGDHSIYEKELGIPKELAYLEDALFEEMSVEDSKTWPEEFLKAIKPGADLSKVVARYTIWEFEDHKKGLKNIKEVSDDKEVMMWCEEVVSLYKRELVGDKPTEDEYYRLYIKIDLAGARAGARAGAWARAMAWAWAGTWARAVARARARARAGKKYREEIMVSANKILELLKSCE